MASTHLTFDACYLPDIRRSQPRGDASSVTRSSSVRDNSDISIELPSWGCWALEFQQWIITGSPGRKGGDRKNVIVAESADPWKYKISRNNSVGVDFIGN